MFRIYFNDPSDGFRAYAKYGSDQKWGFTPHKSDATRCNSEAGAKKVLENHYDLSYQDIARVEAI